jgi:hypothetical protein
MHWISLLLFKEFMFSKQEKKKKKKINSKNKETRMHKNENKNLKFMVSRRLL